MLNKIEAHCCRPTCITPRDTTTYSLQQGQFHTHSKSFSNLVTHKAATLWALQIHHNLDLNANPLWPVSNRHCWTVLERVDFKLTVLALRSMCSICKVLTIKHALKQINQHTHKNHVFGGISPFWTQYSLFWEIYLSLRFFLQGNDGPTNKFLWATGVIYRCSEYCE